MERLLVGKREAAEALSISVRSVERMIASKSLPAVRVRGAVRIPVTALLSLIPNSSREIPSDLRRTQDAEAQVI
jgi:excisionase family DNA binding protein